MQRARPPTRTKTQLHAHGHVHMRPRAMRHMRESTQRRRAFRRAFGHGRVRAGDCGSTSHGKVFFFSSALSALRAFCAFFAAFFSSRLRLRSSCRACAGQGRCITNFSTLLAVPSKDRERRERCATYHRGGGWFSCRRLVRCCLHACLDSLSTAPSFPPPYSPAARDSLGKTTHRKFAASDAGERRLRPRRAAAAHSTLGDGGSEMQGPTAQLKTVDRATTQQRLLRLAPPERLMRRAADVRDTLARSPVAIMAPRELLMVRAAQL